MMVFGIWGRLVHVFKHIFSVFKQHYTYFHALFHSHVFPKNTNNVTRTTLPNGPLELSMNRDDGLGRGSSRFLCFFGNFGGGINLSWVCS